MTRKVKCQGKCKHHYCEECIEVWEDNWKGCPQCVIYEREAREQENKKIPGIKKGRVPPSVRAAEQLEKERIKEEKERIKAEKMAKKYGEKHTGTGPDNTEKSDAEKSLTLKTEEDM